MAEPTPLSTLVREHPVNLPFCTDRTCCDPMEREEVADLKAAIAIDEGMERLLAKVSVCARCLRPGGRHSIHCHRHHTPVPIV